MTTCSPSDVPGVNAPPLATPFDRWLDTRLRNVYGSVLEEPVPQDILNLLRQKLDKQ